MSLYSNDFMFDFTIWKKFEEGHDLGKKKERTFTTMKIDTFVPNYVIRI